jgi:glucose-1-phosphate adenylyltransferase
VEDSIILPNAIVGRNCTVKDAIINEGVVTGDNEQFVGTEGKIEVFGKAKLSI